MKTIKDWARLAGTLLVLSGSFSPAKAAPAVTAPVVLYTDILSGPTTGGEGGNGIYLSIFGVNFGASLPAVQVKIGGADVARIMYLGPSKGRSDIQQITVQVGGLGGGLSNGTPYGIQVFVGGVGSNMDKTFTPLPGTIYFVSPSGVDTTGTTTGGTFEAPFKTLQKAGSELASFNIQSAAAAGAWGRVRAGDFIVMREGTYTDVGWAGYAVQTLNKSGCPIGTNCSQGGGTTSGPITIMGYPNEIAFINQSCFTTGLQYGGGIRGADTARQGNGYGAWLTIANLRVESGFHDGPVNVAGANENPNGAHWRVVNNELTEATCNHTGNVCQSGGVEGSGDGNQWYGNYIHDIYDGPAGTGGLEMHGVYIGGSGSYDVAYNRIDNVPGGSGIQARAGVVTNVHAHHNIVGNVAKSCIVIADATVGIEITNNVAYNCGWNGIKMDSSGLTGAKVYNNTVYNVDLNNRYNGYYAAFMNNYSPVGLDVRNNIFVAGNSHRVLLGGDHSEAISGMSNNLWFNGDNNGVWGTNNVLSDPQFVSTDPASVNSFHLQATSLAIDAGTNAVSSLVTNDFTGLTTRPQGTGFDIGAYEFAGGPTPPAPPKGLRLRYERLP